MRNEFPKTESIRHFWTIVLALLFFNLQVFAQESEPKFSDYPARLVSPRKSVKVKIHSSPDTACFRTMLRDTARKGQRFAGHYALDYWGCGTNCARIGIVDLLTGQAYVSPFYVGLAGGAETFRPIKTMPRSRLVLVNDPKIVAQSYGDPVPEEFAASYFLWTGKLLLPINNGVLERQPERVFLTCRKMHL
jgi:hypothetical protein